MYKKKKIKIKVKKKNFIIFLVIILTILLCLIKSTTTVINLIKDNKEKKEVKEKKPTEKEIKLEKLNNIHKKINYFKDENIDRYIDYKNNNKDLSLKQIIKNVNMNMDLKHYEDIFPATNLNELNILVNKHYYLEEDYIPNNLEEINTQYALKGMKLVNVAKEAFEEMSAAARKENLKIVAMSTYRDYNYQENLYNKYVKQDGIEKADLYSGRPGFSEHQTGLAVDVYNGKETYTNFHKTKEFIWMQEHAKEYGFILRYPENKENETGYEYESWHYRYVGIDIANYINDNNITYEEYCATKLN